MRKRYVYNLKSGKMEEIPENKVRYRGVLIREDIKPYKSIVDGTTISGRKAMRDHDKRYGVTNVSDYKNEWANKAKERAKAFTPGAGYDKERRRERVIQAVDKHFRSK
jgi:hypothetical protein